MRDAGARCGRHWGCRGDGADRIFRRYPEMRASSVKPTHALDHGIVEEIERFLKGKRAEIRASEHRIRGQALLARGVNPLTRWKGPARRCTMISRAP
jgi:hypothetical protein